MLVLALQRYTDSLGPHGFPMEDVVSALADPTNPEAEYGYVAGVPTRMPDGSLRDMPVVDQARKVQQDAEDAYRELLGPDASMNGVFFPVRRVERTPPTP
ncbi:hypothetical protein HUN59_14845 [Curtobacterium sp. Csp2]|uniref:hypothetical protein n=1 Tax=Curtobacterium sp. Csp2 TaxID=2495430 RepID=UPI001580E4F6|nr:hypothetical protein [Curtobacterium sp. Csp2]QKS17318.1 hypothetical protein HUN59_14845 [Curtobacterium sp. Csp2]